MLKEQAKFFNRIAVLLDFAVLIAAFLLAFYSRQQWGGLRGEFDDYLWVLLAILPTWYFLLARYQLYASLRLHDLSHILLAVLKVHLLGGIILASFIYLVEPRGFSRGLFGTFIIVSSLLLGIEKTVLKMILGFIRKRGYNYRNIIIVGTQKKALDFIRLIEHHAAWGLHILGVLQLDGKTDLRDFAGYTVLGRLDDLAEVCKTMPVDEVVFCLTKDSMQAVDDHVQDMEEMGITVRMVLDVYDVRRARRELSFFHGQVPILTFYSKAFNASQLFLKRCLDIVGAVAGLFVTALLFPFIALAIKWDSPGPLLFSQNRVGESGRIFKCWKFRSMHIDAEERKKELMRLNEMSGAIFKIKDDPRITRVGRFLRKTSLDELPQFWNVLQGEMSLVGTRPPTPDEVAKYENWHRKRICIKPGITGLWQISGRNQITDFDEVVRLDLRYIEHWTLWLDIKLLYKTVWIVLAGRGAS